MHRRCQKGANKVKIENNWLETAKRDSFFSHPKLCKFLLVKIWEKLSNFARWLEKFSHALPASGCESDENPTGWRLEPVRLNTHLLRPTPNRVRLEAGQQAWLASRGRSHPRAGSESRWVTGALRSAGARSISPLCLRIPPILHQGGNCAKSTK